MLGRGAAVVGPAASGAQRRIDASGEPARLAAARSVQAFALVLNELVTNARRARRLLGARTGHVELRCSTPATGLLHLAWREKWDRR